jgi:ribosomal protein L11 methyltransferase
MTDADKWYSLEITGAPEASEAIEFALNSLDALGTSINYFRNGTIAGVTVVGYFNELPDDQRFQDELHYALRSYEFAEEIVTTVTRGEIENADWLAEWKKHWKPTTVGRFVIAPPWFDVDEPEKIVIRIEPNMAFGTGTHETTQLCFHLPLLSYLPGTNTAGCGFSMRWRSAKKSSLQSSATAPRRASARLTLRRVNSGASGSAIGRAMRGTRWWRRSDSRGR